MNISLLLIVAAVAALVGFWLARPRGQRNQLDPRFLPSHLSSTHKQMGCTQLLGHVLVVLVALAIVWLVLNAQFNGLVVHFSL